MQESNKHNVFSKEELLKLLAEKKSLPPEADDFDKEAMEGLSLLTNTKKLDGINNSIDEVLHNEKRLELKKRNIYILSAAASVILIITFFFLLKDNSFNKKDKALAENTGKEISDLKQNQEVVTATESLAVPASEKTTESKPAMIEKGESLTKEGKNLGSGITAESNKAVAGEDITVVAPAEAKGDMASVTVNRKVSNEETPEDNDTRNAGGKDYKTTLAKDAELKREETKKPSVDLEDKEKDKKRYAVNTVWTSSTPATGGVATDESLKKTSDDRAKNQYDQN